MKTFQAVIAGGLMGVLATVGGMRLAHADCDYGQSSGAGSYLEARIDADACDTNYGEVVRVRDGWEAYCVPDDVAEGCIEVSSLLDCSLMSAAACDEAMGSMFEACLTLQAAGGR